MLGPKKLTRREVQSIVKHHKYRKEMGSAGPQGAVPLKHVTAAGDCTHCRVLALKCATVSPRSFAG